MLVDGYVYPIQELFRLQHVMYVQCVIVVQLGDKHYFVIAYF
jgi:hypothetical protein